MRDAPRPRRLRRARATRELALVARALLVLALAFAIPAADGADAAFGTRPLVIVAPGAPGTGTDQQARLLAQRMGAALGVDAIVENRTGAGTQIAAEHVARAAADGHTLLMANAAALVDLAANPALRPNLLIDLAPVARIAVSQVVLIAGPGAGLADVATLVARARSAPRSIAYGTAGVASTMKMAAELFERQAGIELMQVPYRSEAQETVAVAGGMLDAAFVTLPSALPFAADHRVLALAVAGDRRSPLLPAVPTFAEAGYPDVVVQPWYAVFAPAGTPPAVIGLVAATLGTIAANDEFARSLATAGLEPALLGPEALAVTLQDELRKDRMLLQKGRP